MKKILLVENSPTIISVADSLLRQQGFDVTCLSDGSQAVDFVKEEMPDLILSSLSLPGIDGIQLCKKITEDPTTGGIPVILLVGDKDDAYLDKIELCGARAQIKKPFSPKELLLVVEKYTGIEMSNTTSTLVDQSTKGAPKLKPRVAPKEIRTSTRSIVDTNKTGAKVKKHETVFNLDWNDLKGEVEKEAAARGHETDESGLILEEDQYGLTNLADDVVPLQNENQEEDYEWFVSSIKEESDDSVGGKKAPIAKKIVQNETPSRKLENQQSNDDTKYRQFLEQFKKETDVLTKDKPSAGSSIDVNWMVDAIAEKLAQKIVEKLDRQELAQIISSILKGKS